MSEIRIFSTGIIRVGDIATASAAAGYGAGPVLSSLTDQVYDVQDVEVPVSYQEKEMRAAPQVSNFARSRSFYGAKQEVNFTVGDYSKLLLKYFAGMTASNGGLTYTLGATSKPLFCHLELDVQDEAGNPVSYVFYRFSAPGLTQSFKLDAYVEPGVKGQADPSQVAATLNRVTDIFLPAA